MKERNRLLEDDIDPHHKKSLRTRFNQSQEWEQSSWSHTRLGCRTSNLLRSLLSVLSGGLLPTDTLMWSLCGLSGAPEMPIASCAHPHLCPSFLSVVTEAGFLDTLLKGLRSSGKHRACWVSHLALTLFKNLVIIESYCASSCIINVIIYYLWNAGCVLDAYTIIHWVTLELHSLLNYDVMLLPAAFAWEWYFSIYCSWLLHHVIVWTGSVDLKSSIY